MPNTATKTSKSASYTRQINLARSQNIGQQKKNQRQPGGFLKTLLQKGAIIGGVSPGSTQGQVSLPKNLSRADMSDAEENLQGDLEYYMGAEQTAGGQRQAPAPQGAPGAQAKQGGPSGQSPAQPTGQTKPQPPAPPAPKSPPGANQLKSLGNSPAGMFNPAQALQTIQKAKSIAAKAGKAGGKTAQQAKQMAQKVIEQMGKQLALTAVRQLIMSILGPIVLGLMPIIILAILVIMLVVQWGKAFSLIIDFF